MQGHSSKPQPGECLTEAERAAMLRRLVEIAEAHAAGQMTAVQAQHEAQQVIAPIKRRVKGLARRAHATGG